MELMFLFLILPFFIYWCVNEKAGLQLGIVALLSIWAIFLYRQLDEHLPVNFDFRWIIIAVIFCGYLLLRNKIEALLAKGGFRAFMICTAAVSFIMILYRPDLEFVFPGGIMLGLCAGYCLNKRYIGFKAAEVLQRTGVAKYLTLLVRFFLGMAVLLLIVFLTGIIIEQFSESQNVQLYGFIIFVLIGIWVSAAAPWVFVRLRLAGAVFDAEWNRKNDE